MLVETVLLEKEIERLGEELGLVNSLAGRKRFELQVGRVPDSG
jgi:hypothetical protein